MSSCQGKMSPTRSSEEDVRYWKDRAEELERELEDFREQSQELEKELEASLEQAEKRGRDYRVRCNKLQLENDSLKDKLEHVTKETSVQISEMQEELSQCRNREEEFVKYIRELEQKNDDLERTQRAMFVSLGEFEGKLNVAIERNALLESELDEKESLQAMVQRLKDEARDMKQEIVVQKRQDKNDNDKCFERIHSGQLDSNKLVTAEIETQTLSSPLKTIGPNNNALPPPTRISAMNIVGDVLRKVGLEKWLCPGCNRVKCCCAAVGNVEPERPFPHPDSLPRPVRPRFSPPTSPKFQSRPFFQQLRNSLSLSAFTGADSCLPQNP